jgi:hypothetical protein
MKKTTSAPRLFRMVLLGMILACPGCRSAGTETPCYAFIKGGALVLNCEAEILSTSDLGIQAFAISTDGRWLAIKTQQSTESSVVQTDDTKVVLLHDNVTKASPVDAVMLSATCGRILAYTRPKSVIDVLADQPFTRPRFNLIRCSADEKVTVGYLEQTPGSNSPGHNLWTSENKLLSDANAYQSFDVSPSGQYIGFATLHQGVVDAICVTRNQKQPQCLTNLTISGPVLSVSDAGEILFEQSTAAECFYRDESHFSPGIAGKTEGSADACVGLFRWRPGDRSAKSIQNLGISPQWITNPSALKEWLRRKPLVDKK